MSTNNESPAALLPCSCGKQPHIVRLDVEPQGDPWYGRKLETFVICECGVCLFDGGFHDGFSSEVAAVEAWNRRASTAPVASESRGSVPDGWTTFVEQMDMLYSDFAKYEKGDPKVPFVVVRDAVVAALNVWNEHGFAAAPTPPVDEPVGQCHACRGTRIAEVVDGQKVRCPFCVSRDELDLVGSAPPTPAVSNGEEGAFTARMVEWKGIRFGVPAQIAKSFMAALEGTNGEPPDWAIAQEVRERYEQKTDINRAAVLIEVMVGARNRARLARSAAAKGEG